MRGYVDFYHRDAAKRYPQCSGQLFALATAKDDFEQILGPLAVCICVRCRVVIFLREGVLRPSGWQPREGKCPRCDFAQLELDDIGEHCTSCDMYRLYEDTLPYEIRKNGGPE